MRCHIVQLSNYRWLTVVIRGLAFGRPTSGVLLGTLVVLNPVSGEIKNPKIPSPPN